MSESGQTRKSALVTAMSAFPPIATKLRTSREVRFVPITDVTKRIRVAVTPYSKRPRQVPRIANRTNSQSPLHAARHL